MVSEYGHSHAVSMCEWPIRLTYPREPSLAALFSSAGASMEETASAAASSSPRVWSMGDCIKCGKAALSARMALPLTKLSPSISAS